MNGPRGPGNTGFWTLRYEKICHGGRGVSCAVLEAIGVVSDGQQSILGVRVSLSKAEVHRRAFLAALPARGLCGLRGSVSINVAVAGGKGWSHDGAEGTVLSGTIAGIPADRVGETHETGIFAYRKVIDDEKAQQKFLVFNYYVNR